MKEPKVSTTTGTKPKRTPEEQEERNLMILAIDEARKSRDEDDQRVHPKVGVVVVKDSKVLAQAHRGEKEPGEHAEFTVLEKKLKDKDVSGATVYTTLEPCTSRNHPKIPCAERLVERRIKRVVIGRLDPNQTIRGRGEWLLCEYNVSIGRFDSDLMRSLMDLNRDFIRDQQSLGLKIMSHPNGTSVRESEFVVRGTYTKKPERDEVCVFLRKDYLYWPQSRLTIKDDGTWQCKVTLKQRGTYNVLVTSVNEDISLMLALYFEVAHKFDRWLGRTIRRLPNGIRVFDEIQVTRS
jgi:pyrimidine deaminase RibD-like protein